VLHEALQRELPAYMVPGVLVPLDVLPLSPNGKLDREKLPAPPDDFLFADRSFVAPRTPVEETVANIWASILNVQPIGVHDNFFEIGGHSLKATHTITQMRSEFDVEIPMRVLFDNPTVEGLAMEIVTRMAAQTDSEELALLLDSLQEDEESELIVQSAAEGFSG
jgi:acyl carrier protein